MPGSAPDFKDLIKQHLVDHYPPDTPIIDIGAGMGTYSNLLSDHFTTIDAIEVFAPYIEEFNLTEKYGEVYNIDALNFPYYHEYRIAILGDVLEHFPIFDATNLLNWLTRIMDEIIVSVPFLTKQGVVNDNEYEFHHQSDLTPEIMTARYPMLKPLATNDFIGVYIKNENR